MVLQAKNATITIRAAKMDYISFGKGDHILIMLPGLGDGLTTVKGKAFLLAMTYKQYAEKYKVYVFSRKSSLADGYSTRDMAQDQAEAMRVLNISQADIMGISQGGMIAQYLAIDYPQMVNKLVLAVSLAKQNETIQNVVNHWIELGEQKNYKHLLIDTVEKSYSEQYLKKARLLYPFLTRIGKPKDFKRFIIQAKSCIAHNAYPELAKIVCPTLIIGANKDQVVGPSASKETAEKIQNSKLYTYQDYGHGVYEEAKDFNELILKFLIP